jgi:hypothetical protein
VVVAGAVSRLFRRGEKRQVPTARIVGAFLSMTAVVISHLIGSSSANTE